MEIEHRSKSSKIDLWHLVDLMCKMEYFKVSALEDGKSTIQK